MKSRLDKSVTLIELLIAVCIFALIIIGFSSIDTFSRYYVIASDRREKLQNDASYVLEHMAQKISQAIGDVNQAQPTVDTSSISIDAAIKVYIDSNPNGMRDGSDKRIAYRFTGSPTAYQIKFCPECTNSPCDACNPNWNFAEILSSRIKSFTCTYSSTDNYVTIDITTCWDPTSPGTCGSLGNPQISMKNRISMPAVSTH